MTHREQRQPSGYGFFLQEKTAVQKFQTRCPEASSSRQPTQVDWIPTNHRFNSEEITFFGGRGVVPLREALSRFDVLVTGPHATPDIPEELSPFIDSRLTRRKQFDFSDVSTRAIGRRWAEIDDHVLYIENPHPRFVLDPNRRPPADLEAGLHEAFRRIRAAGPGRPVDLDGVDSVRPVTFAFEPVLLEPRSAAGWRELMRLLRDCAGRGTDVYTATRDHLLSELIHIYRGSEGAASMLHVVSLHDTMAARIRPDGAITDQRPPSERLPALVSLGNRGDARGEPNQKLNGKVMRSEEVTIAPTELRRIAAAFRIAVGVQSTPAGRDVAINRVYRGGWETIAAGTCMRRAVHMFSAPNSTQYRFGAYMAEFAREALLDPMALAELRAPGTIWPRQSPALVDRIVQRLKVTYDTLRRDLVL